MMLITNETILLFILRVTLGILFFFQGYDKIFNVKLSSVIDFLANEKRYSKIPSWILKISAFFTTYIEFFCGVLLIFGLFTNYSLYLLGINMILVAGAFSIIKPMWDMNQFFPRLTMLSLLLLFPEKWNTISIDYLLQYLNLN